MSQADAGAPAIILAAPFSGASRLAAMLGCHPQVCALPELNLFAGDRIGELLDIADLGKGLTLDGLLRALAQLDGGAQTDAAADRARAWLEAQREQPVAALLQHLLAAAGGRTLVFPDTQSPLRPLELMRLDAIAPQTRWLHLTRHPYVHGVLFERSLRDRLFVPPDYMDHARRPPEIDPQIAWLRCNRNLLERAQGRGDDRYLAVADEGLEQPAGQTLARICDWLGLAAGARELQAMQEPSAWRFWREGPPAAPQGLEAEVYESGTAELAREARKAARLDAALPWRKGGVRFAREVQELAAQFGYR